MHFFSPVEYRGHSQNWGITQCPDGFMYFANAYGVLQYDGQRWEIIDTPFTPSSLFSSTDGRIYVGGSGGFGELSILPNGNRRFQFKLDASAADIPDFVDMWTILEVGEYLFLFTDQFTLRYSPVTGSYRVFENLNPYFLTDFESIIYLQHESGGNFNPMLYSETPDIPAGRDHQIMLGMFPQDAGGFAGFDYQGNIYQVNERDDKTYLSVNRIDEAPEHLRYLENYDVVEVFRGNDGYLMTSKNDGFLTTGRNGGFKNHFTREHGLRNNQVEQVYQDRRGNIWLTGLYGIIKVWHQDNIGLIDHRSGIDGINFDMIDYDGHIYLSSTTGIYRSQRREDGTFFFEELDSSALTETTGNFQLLKHPNQESERLYLTTLYGLFEIHGSEIVLVSENLDGPVWQKPGNPEYIFGTHRYRYLTGLQYENGSWTESDEYIPLFSDYIIQTAQEPDTGVWISYYEQGLKFLQYDFDRGNLPVGVGDSDIIDGPFDISFIFRKADDRSGMREQKHVIFHRVDDQLYFSSEGHLYQNQNDGNFDERLRFEQSEIFDTDDSWSYYNLVNGREDEIWFVRYDDDRTDTGFYRKRDDEIETYHPFRPIPVDQVEKIIYLADHDILFAMTPEKLLLYQKNGLPDESIDEFSIRLRSIMVNQDSLIHFREVFENGNPVSIPFRKNTVKFNVATDYLNDADKNEFSFKLEPLDSEFGRFSNSAQQVYHKLPAGLYTLHVRVKNAHGTIEESQMVQIKVRPPWYMTWIAFVVYLLLFILLIYIIIQYRSNQLEIQKQRLEQEVKLRTGLLLEQSKELKQQKEKYRKANEIKTRLLRFAAHDLRNPITAIMGYSRYLESEEDPKEVRDSVKVIHDISEKMYHIVQNMLAAGARDADSLELDFESVSVREIFNNLKQQYALFLRDKDQTLIINCDENVSEIFADKVRISEVIENLLGNAIKYSPAGSTIQLSAEAYTEKSRVRDMVKIEVSDQGPGFTEEDKSRAFGEFQRLSATPTGEEGSTGLGLFIVKQLVAAHDGRIHIHDLPEGGTNISITIPAVG